MTPEQQTLLEMYKTECESWRHQESQRTAVANLFVLISAALIGLVTHDKITADDVPVGIMIILLGLFGLAFSAKFYERYLRHICRAWSFKLKLECLLEGSSREKISFSALDKEACERARKDSYVARLLFPIRLHWFWFTLYALIFFLGLVILRMAALSNNMIENI